MTRLTALCAVALFAYGLAVGCTGQEHRAQRVVERDHGRPPAWLVEEFCSCGRRVFFEVCPP